MGLALSRAKGKQHEGEQTGAYRAVISRYTLLIHGTCFTINGGPSLNDVEQEEDANSGYVRTRKVFQCDTMRSRSDNMNTGTIFLKP